MDFFRGIFGDDGSRSLKVQNSVSEEILTPNQYQRILMEEPDNIKEVKIIAPKIGSNDFGRVKVKYRNPRLKNVKHTKTKRVTFP